MKAKKIYISIVYSKILNFFFTFLVIENLDAVKKNLDPDLMTLLQISIFEENSGSEDYENIFLFAIMTASGILTRLRFNILEFFLEIWMLNFQKKKNFYILRMFT